MTQTKPPLSEVKPLAPEQARAYMAEHQAGTFTLVDVRQPGEYKKAHLPGARLLPLPTLADSLTEMKPEEPTIVYCASGLRSMMAAQLLTGQGFTEVYNIQGGLNAWEGVDAVGPPEMGLVLIRGDETPGEIIILAYSLEEGLRHFYTLMAEKARDPEVGRIFTGLAEIEVEHKEKLLELYGKVTQTKPKPETLEASLVAPYMEGGLTPEEFFAQFDPVLQTVADVIDVAMMLEAQALDLYMRYAARFTQEETKEVLFLLAEEEKTHLVTLGRLMDQQV